MDIFMKAAAGVLIAAVLSLSLAKQGKDLSLLLSLATVVMVLTAVMVRLSPVFAFFEKLQTIGQLNTDMMQILLKAVGIGLLSEVTALLCEDSGNAALGRALKMLAGVVILWISIPLFESLLELVEEILVIL